MADSKNKRLTCPDCKCERWAFASQLYKLARGIGTARCSPCARAARKLEALARKASREAERRESAPRVREPEPPKPTVCRHCSKAKVNRPKGLCWSCYYTPAVRDLYPSTSKYARRVLPNFSGARPAPAAPTTAAPGTPEKVAVLAERARLGQQLHHDHDARHPGDPRPLEFIRQQGGGRVKVFIPGLTVKSELNAREHWVRVHRRKREQRDAVTAELRLRGGYAPRGALATAPLLRVRMVRVYDGRGRQMDSDNLDGAFKAIRDAIALWLGRDDAPGCGVEWETGQERGESAGVRIEVEPVNPAQEGAAA